jgi:phage portal protein BeeE
MMGILSGIFKSRDKPQNATSGSAYRFFIGGSSSGKNVNERSAMQMTAVYSCVRILSEAVASLPLHVYKYNRDGGKEKAVKHPLYFLLHDEPNPEMTSFVFRETLMTHLLLWGNAYAQIIRNGKGEIIALYPLMPNRMTVDRDDKGQLYYQYKLDKDSIILLEQIRTIDKQRLKQYIGLMPDHIMARVDKALAISLDLFKKAEP